jgi:hypothetical protein
MQDISILESSSHTAGSLLLGDCCLTCRLAAHTPNPKHTQLWRTLNQATTAVNDCLLSTHFLLLSQTSSPKHPNGIPFWLTHFHGTLTLPMLPWEGEGDLPFSLCSRK